MRRIFVLWSLATSSACALAQESAIPTFNSKTASAPPKRASARPSSRRALRSYRGFVRLLDLGADPNVVFDDNNSIMQTIVLMRDDRFLAAALEHGGDPNLGAGTPKTKSRCCSKLAPT